MHRLANPTRFLKLISTLKPWAVAVSLVCLATGLYFALIVSPADYQQSETVRIMYVHVPASWMAIFCYIALAGACAVGLIWRPLTAVVVARATAPIGTAFTFLALVTGSLWGKPMWGTWWVWDARLTSELILLFLYLGYMALVAAIDDRRTASRAGAVLAIVGVVNLPIIHFSVEWWNTLHQGPTVTKFDQPSIAISMLIPLLLMAAAFKFHYLYTLLARVRVEILESERRTAWVSTLVTSKAS